MPSTSSGNERRPLGAILALLALAGLGGALVQTMVSPALPEIADGIGASTSQATWVLTAVLLSASVTTPIIGRLGDGYGVKRVLVILLLVVGAGLVVSALSTNLSVMVIGRVIQGFAGGVFPLAFTAIRKFFPPDRVAGSVGLLSGTLGIGSGIGVVLSGVLVDSLGFRWLFWVPLVMELISVLAIALVMPSDRGESGIRINWVAAVLMGAGLAVVLFTVSEAPEWGWTSARTIGIGILGIVLVIAWVLFERRSSNPLVDMRTLRHRAVWATDLTGILLGAAMFGAFILIPQYAQSPRSGGFGFSATVTQAGLLLLPQTIAMLLVGPLAGRLRRLLGPRMPIILGATSALAAYLLLLFSDRTIPLVLVASLLLGIGIGSAYSAMANVIIDAVPANETGVSTGVNTVARQLGGAFGASLAATLLASSTLSGGGPTLSGYESAFTLAAGLALAAVLAGLVIPRTTTSPAEGTVAPAATKGSPA